MIGLIGYQEDAIGFGLTGIQHIQEVTPDADAQTVQQAIEQLREDIEVLIIPASLRALATDTHELMIIEIPEKNSSKQDEITALAKELLGVNI